ncbi:RDD family protein [Pauljensenia sp. UMB3104]|uniref:RDD family protein n=1 Tax=Pauljensenia sp. UMB3104 TaxID=3046331 RepID=UPI00254BF4BC|nr:RDD family protein [Pauljensenia sp. UMB3104]MDK7160071.1 RDD family protein [Pauljensenia sp. UMB3104]
MPDTTKTPFASATPSRLVGAYVIDMLVLGALLAATWLVYFTPLTITLITVEAVIAAGIMLGATGRTPGMAAMRVCLIRDEDDAQTPSLGAAMGYIALTALLQITIVGPLACLAMARDGRTWLTGPTRTRLVDLRQHAALAAGPGAAGMAGYSERPRPGQAPSGFESVHPASSPNQWGAPSAPLTPVPQAALDYSAPGQRANDPYGPDYSAPSVPAAPPQGVPDAHRPAPQRPAYAPDAQAPAPSSQIPSMPTFSSPPSDVPAAPASVPQAPAPASQAPAAPSVPTFSSPASDVPAAPASVPQAPAPAQQDTWGAPAQQDTWGAPAQQAPARSQYSQSAPASYSEPSFETMPYRGPNGAVAGMSAPPPTRRAVQAGQAAQQAYAAQQAQAPQGGRSQWGAPAAPARPQLLWLIFDSGQRELIDEPLVLGRRPAPVEGSRSVIVPDTTLSLSRTHMRIGPTATGVWIEDAFSANGTEIRTPDGRISALAGGQAVEVPPGTEIIVVDRRATIVLADADSVQ